MKKDINFIDTLEIKIRSEEEILKERYDYYKNNPNEFSFWYPRIRNVKDFSIPKSWILKLNNETFKCFYKDGRLTDEENNLVKSTISEFIKDNNIQLPVFVKNGQFSNKFDFYTCGINESVEQICDNIHRICYASICLGASPSFEIVFRELIKTNTKYSMYRGMNLNIEYRAFVDFDKKELLGIIDYWHKSIKNNIYDEKDREQFLLFKKDTEDKYKEYEVILKDKLLKQIENFNLKGKWSVDFLLDDNNNFHLIDMAIAERSFGFNLL